MRQGEILSIRWEHVSWKKRTVLLPMTKNGSAREVPLSRAAYDIFQSHLTPKSEGLIFGYTRSGIKSTWRYFIKATGIENLHFHDLRHCAISSLLERGLSSIEVAAISGHKSMSMLKRYSHLFAHKLVSKLDPKPRVKKDRPVLRDHLPAYPAIVTKLGKRVDVDFPDFVDLSVSARDEADAMQVAANRLLKTVVSMLCDGAMPPTPSPTEAVSMPSSKSRVEMISPL